MLNLTVCLIILFKFSLFSSSAPNSCYWKGLILNLFCLITQLLILVPTIWRFLCNRSHNHRASLRNRFEKSRLKALAISRARAPLYCLMALFIAVTGIYSIISEIFNWTNFSYLFSVVCLSGCLLNDVCLFMSIRQDPSTVYAI